jgi:hypothetical protein
MGHIMAAIKDIAKSSDKWQRRASVATPDYQAGVANPRRPWAEAAAAGDANYKAGVTAAATKGSYAAGIKRAGNQRWLDGATNKGPARYAEGVALAVQDWQTGFQPYQQAISSLALPARGPAGSPQNLQRVAAVANANRQLKERLGK